MPSLTLDWLHVLILLGAIQGVFLTVALTTKRRNRTANRRPDVALGEFLTDDVNEGWADFTYGGHRFTVNNQFGECWFFVDDPRAPEDILRGIADYCAQLLAS